MRLLVRSPLDDVTRLRWAVRIAIPFFILLYVPIDRFVFGMTWEQILYVSLSILIAGQVIFHVVLHRFLRLQKRARYPALLAVELGTDEDLQQAAERSTSLIAEWLGARAAVMAWLDDEGHTIPMCSYRLSPGSLGIGAVHLSDVSFGRSVRAGRSILAAANEVPQWAGSVERGGGVAVIPISAHGRVTGVLFLVADRWTGDMRDPELRDSLGAVAGSALAHLSRQSRVPAP